MGGDLTGSFSAAGPLVGGLDYSKRNLYSTSVGSNCVFIHSGISSTLTGSVAVGGQPVGVKIYGGSMVTADDQINFYSGLSTTKIGSITSPGGLPAGVEIYDGNLLIASEDATSIYIMSGISDVITGSFAAPGGTTPLGIAVADGNLITTSPDSNQIYFYDGIGSTVTGSITGPGEAVAGITIENVFEGSGTGTAGDPYQIRTWTQLSDVEVELDANYILMDNINQSTSDYNTFNSGTNTWLSMGSPGGFTGFINGNDKFIEGLVSAGRAVGNGIFYNINISGTLSGLTVLGQSAGTNNVALITGNNNGSIIGCRAVGSILDGYNGRGGIAGYNYGRIQGCSAKVDVLMNAGFYAGCLVGNNSSGGAIEDCFANGVVSGASYIGGIAGRNAQGVIKNSYSTARVKGTDLVGGIAGNCWGGSVINCYSAGSISVSGTNNIGGICGSSYASSQTNCFYDSDITGDIGSDFGLPKTTAQMQDIDTFSGAGWDIALKGGHTTETWWIE